MKTLCGPALNVDVRVAEDASIRQCDVCREVLDFFDVRDGVLVGHGVGGSVFARHPDDEYSHSQQKHMFPRFHCHPIHVEQAQACKVEALHDPAKFDLQLHVFVLEKDSRWIYLCGVKD